MKDKPRCSCGSTDFDEEAKYTGQQTWLLLVCRKCRLVIAAVPERE